VHVILATDLGRMLADVWTARAFVGGVPGWRAWLRRLEKAGDLPLRIDPLQLARSRTGRATPDQIHVVLDPGALPALVGVRRPPAGPTELVAEAPELARRIGAVVGLLVPDDRRPRATRIARANRAPEKTKPPSVHCTGGGCDRTEHDEARYCAGAVQVSATVTMLLALNRAMSFSLALSLDAAAEVVVVVVVEVVEDDELPEVAGGVLPAAGVPLDDGVLPEAGVPLADGVLLDVADAEAAGVADVSTAVPVTVTLWLRLFAKSRLSAPLAFAMM
jgi:hypothetical protein